MAVIADFASYPDWVDSMKSATVLTKALDGRADTVRMVLDHALVKDEYTLAYVWKRNTVSWKLVDGNLLNRAGPRMIAGTAVLCEKLELARQHRTR